MEDIGLTRFVGLAPVESAKIGITVRRFDTETGEETSRWSSEPLKEVPDTELIGGFGDGKV